MQKVQAARKVKVPKDIGDLKGKGFSEGDVPVWSEDKRKFVPGEMGGGPIYKVYSAILNQSGANAPTAIVLENTLGITPVWHRMNTGIYSLVAPTGGAFPIGKTIVLPGWMASAFPDPFAVGYEHEVTDRVTLVTGHNASTKADALMTKMFVEIRVYP